MVSKYESRLLDNFAVANTDNNKLWNVNYLGDQLNFRISKVQLRNLYGVQVLSLDITASCNGIIVFDDRINFPNPPVGVTRPNGVVVIDPVNALKLSVLDSILSVTNKLQNPHLARLGPDTFIGDTLAVRGDTTDGRVSCSDTVWANVQGATGTLSSNTTATSIVPDVEVSAGTYACIQAFIQFDTSPLGSSATVSAYVLTLYANGTAEQDDDGTILQCKVYDWGASLTTADYRTNTQWSALTSFATITTNTWVQTGSTANDLTSAGALSSVNKTGSTRLILTMDRFTGAAPAGANSITFRSADTAGTSTDPLLTVTYTGPSLILSAKNRVLRRSQLRR